MIHPEILNTLGHVASQLASDREFCLIYTDESSPPARHTYALECIITDEATRALALQHLSIVRASLDAYFFPDRVAAEEALLAVLPKGEAVRYAPPNVRAVATRVAKDLLRKALAPSNPYPVPPTSSQLRDQVTYSARALALPKPRPESQCLAAQLVAYELALPYSPILLEEEDAKAAAATLANLINLHMGELEWPPINSALNLPCLNHSMLVSPSQNPRILARTSIVDLAKILIKNLCFLQSDFTYAGADRQRIVLTHIAHIGLPMPSNAELNRLTNLLARYMCMAPSLHPAALPLPTARNLTVHEVAEVVAALDAALLEADAPITRYLHKWNNSSKEVTPLAMRKVIHACCIQLGLPIGSGPALEAIRRYLFPKSPGPQGYLSYSKDEITAYLTVSPDLTPTPVPKAEDRLTPLLDTLLASPDVIQAVTPINSNEENRRIVGLALITYKAHCGEVWSNTHALTRYVVDYLTGLTEVSRNQSIDSSTIHSFNWVDGVLTKPGSRFTTGGLGSITAGSNMSPIPTSADPDCLLVTCEFLVNGVNASTLTIEQLEGLVGHHVVRQARHKNDVVKALDIKTNIAKLINYINDLRDPTATNRGGPEAATNPVG